MQNMISTNAGIVFPGMRIRIEEWNDPDQSYVGREGEVTFIDDAGQIHGTWGGAAVLPYLDKISIIH